MINMAKKVGKPIASQGVHHADNGKRTTFIGVGSSILFVSIILLFVLPFIFGIAYNAPFVALEIFGIGVGVVLIIIGFVVD
jgi:uncharacterized membrane protein (DUF485 family)